MSRESVRKHEQSQQLEKFLDKANILKDVENIKKLID